VGPVEDRGSLSELLDRWLREHSESGRSFARRADLLGHDLSYSTVNDLRRGALRKVSDAKLDAIADTAGLPRAQVYAAAGLPAPGRPFAEELPDGVDLLDQRERNAVVELLKVMVDRRTRPSGEVVPSSPPVALAAALNGEKAKDTRAKTQATEQD
jgi:hypothetical protein